MVVDTAPIIYFLEEHPEFGPRYQAFFERAEAGRYELLLTTVSLTEVLTGPLRIGDEALAQRYRDTLTAAPTWRLVELNANIAHRAARIRARTRMLLPDAVQAAAALESSSVALVTNDRDFSALDLLDERIAVYA